MISKGKWSVGIPGTVVTDIIPENYPAANGHDDISYYGGFLLAESIGNPDDGRLFAAAKDLLEACENLENDDNSIPPHAWHLIQAAIFKATGKCKR